MSKFWNYFSTPKVAFLVLVWAAAALQLFVNMGIQKEDKIIDVPCGTVVYNAETGEYIWYGKKDESASDGMSVFD